jgi:hypothetical protein
MISPHLPFRKQPLLQFLGDCIEKQLDGVQGREGAESRIPQHSFLFTDPE